MAKTKSKSALMASGLSLVLCFAMLLGTTFAWFSDSVSNKGNKITAGDLKIGFYVSDKKSTTLPAIGATTADAPTVGDWTDLKFSTAPIFTMGTDVAPAQPGDKLTKYIAIRNEGSIALKYILDFIVEDSGLGDAVTFAFKELAPNTANSATFTGTQLKDQRIKGSSAVRNEFVVYQMDLAFNESAGNTYQDGSFSLDLNLAATQNKDGAEFPWDGVTVTPVTPKDGIYTVSTGAELAWIAQQINNPTAINRQSDEPFTVQLDSDINLNGMEWTPIGGDNAFSGTFDGNGHTIENLTASRNIPSSSPSRGIALFGYVENAVIKNLKFENCDIQGRYAVSAVVGDGYAPLTFENIEVVSGTIQANQDEPNKLGQVAGGILGQGFGPSGTEIVFKNCINRANITVNKQHAGGLWGSVTSFSGGTVRVENGHNYGAIESKGVGYAGGLGGFLSAEQCIITDSTNSGNVTASTFAAEFVASFNGSSINGNTESQNTAL